jgi:hypothetical protein
VYDVNAGDMNLLKVEDSASDLDVLLLSDILPTAWHANELAEVPTPTPTHTRIPTIDIPTSLRQSRIMQYLDESLKNVVLAWRCRCTRVTWCASGGRVPWASWRRTVPSTATPRASHSSTRSVP